MQKREQLKLSLKNRAAVPGNLVVNGTLHFTIAESSETTSNEGNLPSPIVPYEDFEFRLPASTMGAYSTAAVSTDTRPCAKVGT